MGDSVDNNERVRSSSEPSHSPSPMISSSTSTPTSSSRSLAALDSPSSVAQRPVGLPKKPKALEEKHKKEYFKMLVKYKEKLEKEQVEKEKLEKKRLDKENQMRENTRIWRELLANWSKHKDSRRIRTMWWRGVPPQIRGRAWLAGIENKLHVTKELFKIFGRKAEEAKEIDSEDLSTSDCRENTVQLIELDLPRTFPALSFFARDGPMFKDLKEVLEAYVCYRPDIGYVQGMSYLAAILLLNMEKFDAFQCLCNLVNTRCLLVFYKMQSSVVVKYFDLAKHLINEYTPKVSAVLTKQRIGPETFIVDWILTVYAKALPLDISGRVWDIFIGEGEYFLWRAMLGMLCYLERNIVANAFDENMHLLTHLIDVQEDEFFKSIEKIYLTKAKYHQLHDHIIGDFE